MSSVITMNKVVTAHAHQPVSRLENLQALDGVWELLHIYVYTVQTQDRSLAWVWWNERMMQHVK